MLGIIQIAPPGAMVVGVITGGETFFFLSFHVHTND